MKYWLVLALATGLVTVFFTVRSPDERATPTAPEPQEAAGLQNLRDSMATEASGADASGATIPQTALPFDCSDECLSLKQDADRYTYCRSVCGFSLTDPTSGTAVKPTNPSLEQDIERKDTAIKNRDLAACESITDEQIKKSCQIRVTEDLLE